MYKSVRVKKKKGRNMSFENLEEHNLSWKEKKRLKGKLVVVSRFSYSTLVKTWWQVKQADPPPEPTWLTKSPPGYPYPDVC